MSLDDSEDERYQCHLMLFEENRLKTFVDWPFSGSDCSCTPEKLAEAGFYHCPTEQEPDAVRCFVCHKELDGWDPTDDPLDEHKKHSKDCPFLALSDRKNMTIADAMEMTRQRYRILVTKTAKQKIEELMEHAALGIKQMEKLL